MGVPPLPMQRHIVGVPERFLVPLQMVARAVLVFLEQYAHSSRCSSVAI